jgi:hypothetical protein
MDVEHKMADSEWGLRSWAMELGTKAFVVATEEAIDEDILYCWISNRGGRLEAPLP